MHSVPSVCELVISFRSPVNPPSLLERTAYGVIARVFCFFGGFFTQNLNTFSFCDCVVPCRCTPHPKCLRVVQEGCLTAALCATMQLQRVPKKMKAQRIGLLKKRLDWLWHNNTIHYLPQQMCVSCANWYIKWPVWASPHCLVLTAVHCWTHTE